MNRTKRLAVGMIIIILWIVSLSGCSNTGNNSGVQLDSTVEDGIEYFLIKTEEDLRSIGGKEAPLFANYKLDNDIVLAKDWKPIGSIDKPFTGIFDGNGYKISNFKIEKDIPNIGFFAAADGATIKNVTLDDVNVQGSDLFPIVNVAMNCAITDCTINSKQEPSLEMEK